MKIIIKADFRPHFSPKLQIPDTIEKIGMPRGILFNDIFDVVGL